MNRHTDCKHCSYIGCMINQLRTKYLYTFLHHRLGIKFHIRAYKYYEAVLAMELLHGPERHWVSDYMVLINNVPLLKKAA